MFFIQDAYAQAAGNAAPGGGLSPILMMIGIFAIMWFFMFRPQQKKVKEHQALVAGLKKGDEVITSGGLMGRIADLDAYSIDLEIAKNTVIRLQRPFVTQVLPKGSLRASLGSEFHAEKKHDKRNKHHDKAEKHAEKKLQSQVANDADADSAAQESAETLQKSNENQAEDKEAKTQPVNDVKADNNTVENPVINEPAPNNDDKQEQVDSNTAENSANNDSNSNKA